MSGAGIKAMWRRGEITFYDYLSSKSGKLNRAAALRIIFARYLRAKKVLFSDDLDFFRKKMIARDFGRFGFFEKQTIVYVRRVGAGVEFVRYGDWRLKDRPAATREDIMVALIRSENAKKRESEIWA